MQKIQLPKLKRIDVDRPKKKKILLLSDDLRMHSGIATMSKEFVLGTADTFDWVQIGAAVKHPDHGKVFDLSDDVNREVGIDNASVKIFAHTGYGNPEVLREVLTTEKPDAILHFTDPRFWGWLYSMEHELRSGMGIPLMYYNIWDSPPAPFWNSPFYRSCDLIMNISKQTHNLVKMVLGPDEYNDIDSGEGSGERMVAYVPHGINDTKFYPITDSHEEYDDYKKFVEEFKTKHKADFIFFWNNRNIRRKNPADIILAFKTFCDTLTPEQIKEKRPALFMHTAMRDPNGTDLPEVARVIAPKCNIIFNEDKLSTSTLNMFYNMANVTINIASNEGFGLSSAESIMAGTPIINNTTGGLQDQCRFEDASGEWINFTPDFTSNHGGRYKNHGKWAKVVYPSNRSLQGSLATPYIFDDRCSFEDVANVMGEWYKLSDYEIDKRGYTGRQWLLSKESGMSAKEMSNRMRNAIQKIFDEWKPKSRFELFKVDDQPIIEQSGIVLNG